MQKGDVVKSTAGHDSGRLYVVLDLSCDFALVADGFYKKPAAPKKKNVRHLKFVCSTDLCDKITLTQVKKAVKDAKTIAPK